MEIHQLRYVAAAAKIGNFSRAAEQCHVTQPTLSQQIQKLEDELGCRLFIRQKRSIKLTPQGDLFLPRALRILQEVDAARRDAADSRDLVAGSVTLGILPTIAPFLLPSAISAFTKKHPGISIVGREETTARLVVLALAQEIDFAIVSRPILESRLEVLELFSEELLVALPMDHPLSKKSCVKTDDLENERMIVLRDEHCLGVQVTRFCEQRDLRPAIWFHSSQLDTVLRLVRSGQGISIVPRMAAMQDATHTLTYLPVHPKPPRRTLVAIWSKANPPSRAAKEFISFFAKPSAS